MKHSESKTNPIICSLCGKPTDTEFCPGGAPFGVHVLEGEYMDHPEDVKFAPIAGTAYRSNFTYDELARLHYGRMRLGNVAAYLYRKYKRELHPDDNVWRAYDIILALLAKVDGRIRTMERIIVDAPVFTIPSPHTSLMTSRNEDDL